VGIILRYFLFIVVAAFCVLPLGLAQGQNEKDKDEGQDKDKNKDKVTITANAPVSNNTQSTKSEPEAEVFAGSTVPLSVTYWPQTFWHSLMTKWSMQREAYDQSYQHSLKALETDPLSPELQINLGNSLEGLGSISKARDAYATSEKLTRDPVIHFQSRFNQAQAFAKEKKIDEALNFYQKALEIDPSSKIVKTNIELLLSASGGNGGKGDKDQENQDDQNEGEGQDQDKSKQPKEPKKFAQNPKPSPGKKQPQDLSQGDIKKILEEIKQQEQKIRGDYYKQSNNEQKQKGSEGKREKDW